MKIGLALSGGGSAPPYSTWVSWRGSRGENRLEDVSYISTRFGGSLCAGFIYAPAVSVGLQQPL